MGFSKLCFMLQYHQLGTQCCWYEKKLEKSDPKQTTFFLKSRIKTDQFSQKKNRSEKIFLYHILSVNFCAEKFLRGQILAWIYFRELNFSYFAWIYFCNFIFSDYFVIRFFDTTIAFQSFLEAKI